MGLVNNHSTENLSVWWQNTRLKLDPIRPLIKQNVAAMLVTEAKSYEDLVHGTSLKIRDDPYPSYADLIQTHILMALQNLEAGLVEQQNNEPTKARTYFYVARIKWLIVEAILSKQGLIL